MPTQNTLHKLSRLGLIAGLVCIVSASAFAADDTEKQTEPPYVDSLENAQPQVDFTKNAKDKKEDPSLLSTNIRAKALKEAALSYGARGGLAWRTFKIRQMLENHGSYMDKVYNFSQLLIPAPSGLLIEPPIITEDDNALIINKEGQEAAVSDRLYNINKNAQIVSAPRMWRNYLERDWGEVTPPPDILLPENKVERENWIKYVREGWAKGIDQADEIYQDDLNQLTANYQGMVRYRMLLAQGMVSPPYALQIDRGVTGGGNEMRVGDRAVQITGRPELQTGSDQWQPANR